jgi:hypothetical protein
MTAHQPNLFAYSGVFRKATLNFALARALERMLNVPVVSFFGIADQDFTDDRWVKSFQLPAVQRSEGVFSIEANLPEKFMLSKVAKPSLNVLENWKTEIEKWLNDAIRSVARLSKELGIAEPLSPFSTASYRNNLDFFWKIVEDCHKRSRAYSDFSAFMLSKVINDTWGYDTLFARFSECQQIFVDEFSFLLSHFDDYSRLLKETKKTQCSDIGRGVSEQEPCLVPFWFHCKCGSKVKLVLEENGGSLSGKGSCVRCGEHNDLDFGPKGNPQISSFARRMSARAIPMCLVFFKGLMPSCYVGGIGGAEYLTEAEHVSRGLGVPFPPTAVWRPHDKYFGVGQTEALLELRRICKAWGAHDVLSTKRLLESRISEIRARLNELEESRKRTLEQLKKDPSNHQLKGETKKISVTKAEIARSSRLSVIVREMKILGNVSAVSELIPSIVDYAINIGLNETNNQWIDYLSENGNLFTDVSLEALLSFNDWN